MFLSLSLFIQSKAIVVRFLILAAITTLAASSGQAASPGALDLTFGTRGTAAVRPESGFQEPRAVAVQSDGKVVLAGYLNSCAATCNSNFVVVRFNANGTLDNSFGTNGSAITDYFGQNEGATAVAIQADGKIVVAGGLFSIYGNSGQNITGFKLVRYMPDGSLDTTFGTGGIAYESNDDLGGITQSMILQPDGKIVVAGTDEVSMLFVDRFNPNGGLDASFGTNGRIALNTYNVHTVKINRQADGKIIVAGVGSPNDTLKLIRFNADGTPDTNFGSGGLVTSTFNGGFTPTAPVQTGDKILVSGAYGSSDLRTPLLRRFNADGSVDTSFVPNNGATTNGVCILCTEKPAKILLLPDGRFYLVGYNAMNSSSSKTVAVSRYLSNGTIDSSFGFRGASLLRYSNVDNSLVSVKDAALQADGKIVIAAGANLTVNNFQQEHLIAMRINSVVTPPSVRGDFDGDLKTDFAVFRPSSRFWYVLNSSDNSFLAQRYGADGDILTPGDYNYDRKTDLAIFRPSTKGWTIFASLPAGGGYGDLFGQSNDITVPEDYDGDGYTDIATFRPSDGTWHIRYSMLYSSSLGGSTNADFPFGFGTDKPVPADFDGDGKADIAVFRPSNGYWYILRSSDGVITYTQFGFGTDKTVQGDYDGDGKADIAVVRDGMWYILRSSDGGFVGIQWGFASDKPAPGDYDSDGKTDIAVFRPSDGYWYVRKSSDSSFIAQPWGVSEDIPIPFTFVR